MGEQPNDPLIEFGGYLEDQLIYHSFRQSDLVRASGLDKRVVSRMVQGDSDRLTPSNFFRWLEGVIRLEIITKPHEARYWWKRFCEAKGTKKYRPLEDVYEGREILNLLDEKAKANLEKVLETLDTRKLLTDDEIEFIGRRKEIRKILKKLIEPDTKLFIITGIPGVGKTELAIQIAELAKIYFSTVQKVLLDRNDTQLDMVLMKILQQIKDRDKETRTLILLDNIEQIKNRDELKREIDSLCKDYPQLTILATSRIQLGNNKYEHEVKPFETPGDKTDRETLKQNESIQLIIAAAKKKNDEFEFTEQYAQTAEAICTVVDGLPLALLIMGYWIRELLGKSLRDQLFKLPIKHLILRPKNEEKLTLYQVIAISYDLLGKERQGERLQALFRRLGVFDGTCSHEAVANICSLDDDLLTSLDDPNLIGWLDTLRECHLITFLHEMVRFKHNSIHDVALQILKDEKADREEWTEWERIFLQYVFYYDDLVTNYMQTNFVPNDRLFAYDEGIIFADTEITNQPENLSAVFRFLISSRSRFMKRKLREYLSHDDFKEICTILKKYDHDISLAPVTIQKKYAEVIKHINEEAQNSYPTIDLWVKFWSQVVARIIMPIGIEGYLGQGGYSDYINTVEFKEFKRYFLYKFTGFQIPWKDL